MTDAAGGPGPGPAVGEYRAPRTARPLRVVYVWDADYPWDVRAEKTCAALTAAGHSVHLVARNAAWRPRVERLDEAMVHRMPPWRWLGKRLDRLLGFPAFFNPRWIRLIDHTVSESAADLLVARDLPLCPAALSVGRLRGVPVVLDMAENYPAMLRALHESGRRRWFDRIVRSPRAATAVERWCLGRVERVWVVAEEAADRLIDLGYPRERIDLILNTPRLPAHASTRTESVAPGQPVVVAYLGLLQQERGITELIDAAELLRRRGRCVQVHIIGDGRDAEVFRVRARQLGLGEAEVKFLGYRPSSEALELLAQADIGVNPIHRGELHDTCIPNKLFDYMASGLPVITSDTVPSARVVRETGAGEVFRAGDAGSLADAVDRLMSADERQRAGTRGLRAIRARYHWERDAETLLRSVESVVP